MAARISRIWSRGFAKTKNAESLKAWSAYREDMKKMRSQFRREWLLKEQEQQEAASAQAVQEQRLEKIEEEKNLKDNVMELARMEQERELRTAKRLELTERKQREGTERRMLFEGIIQEKRQQEVEKQMVEGEQFVSMDNIDEVITRALNNPVDYNYALKPDGHKLY